MPLLALGFSPGVGTGLQGRGVQGRGLPGVILWVGLGVSFPAVGVCTSVPDLIRVFSSDPRIQVIPLSPPILAYTEKKPSCGSSSLYQVCSRRSKVPSAKGGQPRPLQTFRNDQQRLTR